MFLCGRYSRVHYMWRLVAGVPESSKGGGSQIFQSPPYVAAGLPGSSKEWHIAQGPPGGGIVAWRGWVL